MVCVADTTTVATLGRGAALPAQCGEAAAQEVEPDQGWVTLRKSFNLSESPVLYFSIRFRSLCIGEFSGISKNKQNNSKMGLWVHITQLQ